MSNPIIICPTGCDTYVPPFTMDDCDPVVDISEVSKLYITNIGYGLADWTSLAEWQGRIDNVGLAVDDIRELNVSGEVPEPERNVIPIDNEREVSSPMSFTMNIEIFETNTDNYDAIRFLQCGGRKLVWFAAGDYLYGGTDGIEADIIASHVITKGSKEINKIMLQVKWDGRHNVERITNPML